MNFFEYLVYLSNDNIELLEDRAGNVYMINYPFKMDSYEEAWTYIDDIALNGEFTMEHTTPRIIDHMTAADIKAVTIEAQSIDLLTKDAVARRPYYRIIGKPLNLTDNDREIINRYKFTLNLDSMIEADGSIEKTAHCHSKWPVMSEFVTELVSLVVDTPLENDQEYDLIICFTCWDEISPAENERHKHGMEHGDYDDFRIPADEEGVNELDEFISAIEFGVLLKDKKITLLTATNARKKYKEYLKAYSKYSSIRARV